MLQLVTFLTFNVLFPSELPYAITEKLEKIAQIVVGSNCTVAVLQELQGHECKLLRHLDALEPGAWKRADDTAIFTKLPLVCAYSSGNKFLQAAELLLESGHRVRVINAHWWPSEYAITLMQQSLLGHTDGVCATRTDVPLHLRNRSKHGECYGFRTEHRRPADAVALADAAGAGETVVVAGDFNEPSHLDWSERYEVEGKNRWRGASVPLKQAVAFPGSRLMETHGFSDAYRNFYPDEVRFPGDTVTPFYNQSKWLDIKRGPWSNQVQARIDRIYFRPGTGAGVWTVAAAVIGEADVGGWPSDHRAVAAGLLFETEPSAADGGCPGEWHPGTGRCGPALIVYLSVGFVLAALVITAAGLCSRRAEIRERGCRRPSCGVLLPWKKSGYAAVATAVSTQP